MTSGNGYAAGMSRLWLLVVLAACSGDDGSGGNVTWSWTFVDPSTHAKVTGCPADVVAITAWHFQGGGEAGSGYTQVAYNAFACEAGEGSFTLPVGSYQLLVQPSVNGHMYAEISASVSVKEGMHASGHTDITVGRGFPHVTWNLVSRASGGAGTCPTDSVVDSTLELRDTYPCGAREAWLPGQEAGSPTIRLYLGRMFPNGFVPDAQADVVADIVADTVTEVPVTFTVP